VSQPFIGRKRELKDLERRIFVRQPSPDHQIRSASLVGPQGIGKRTLLRKATELFEAGGHANIHLFQRGLSGEDTLTVLLRDLAFKFSTELTQVSLCGLPDAKSGLIQKMLENYRWFSDNSDVIAANPCNRSVIKNVKDKFEGLLKIYTDLGHQIILIISEFDNAMNACQEGKQDASLFNYLYRMSQKSSELALNLNVLLVCERRPQYIARLKGSVFEAAFPPTVLHNFTNVEMEEYFQSFKELPCGVPDDVLQRDIMKYCGRFPQLLMDLRDQISRQDLWAVDVKQLAGYSEKGGLYHHLCRLMESQSVDFGNHISLLDVFRQYFLHDGTDDSLKADISQLYGFGLVDMLEDGSYVPLTQSDTGAEPSNRSFLSYVQANFCTQKLSGQTHPNEHGKPPAKVSWLHLSDLHVFQEADTHFLLDEYRQLAKKIRPQFILVTGDFRHKGKKTDFSEAEKFLTEILKIFRIEKRNVILVPGNHDAGDSTNQRETAINEITTHVDSYNEYAQYTKGPFSLYSNFYEFGEFVKSFYRDSGVTDDRILNPGKNYNFVWNNQLNILCINTALISDGDRTHKEIVDINTLQELVREKIVAAYPTIVIGHHGMEALYPEFKDRVYQLFDHKINAYLYGDMHKYNTGDWNGPFPAFCCGKSAPQSGDSASDVGVIFYEWCEDDNVYVTFYQWANKKLRENTWLNPGLDEKRSFSMRCKVN